MTTSGSPQFDTLKAAFAADASLRTETEWAFRLAVETYNPTDNGLRFITGGIGEWIITLALYHAGIITLPDGHRARGHDTATLLGLARALWSVKTSYAAYRGSATFTITNGQGGAGQGLVVPTIFLAPGLPGIVYANPEIHTDLLHHVIVREDSTAIRKDAILAHAEAHPECVIPLDMPVNPGAAIRDPALEAVKILLDGPQFPRLNKMFAEAAARANVNVVDQLRELQEMRDQGQLDGEAYEAAVRAVTGLA